MGKATHLGLLPKDDPILSGGPEPFSRQEFRQSSTSSASGPDGATRAASTTATTLPWAPKREAFKSQDAFEEATGYWQEHVGRIKAMSARQQALPKPPTTGADTDK